MAEMIAAQIGQRTEKMVAKEMSGLVVEASVDILQFAYNNSPSSVFSVIYKTFEQVLWDPPGKDVTGKSLDSHISLFLTPTTLQEKL